jgi:peptidoglycan/LPS O-acetylase OafA/YrhL
LSGLGKFWRRRAVLVLVPYLAWTVVYFFIGLPGLHDSAWAALGRFADLVLVGYSQLYFVVVLVQFYVLFPLVLTLLRATRRHHGRLIAASAVLQLAYTGLMHWSVLPGWLVAGTAATREVMPYQFYLLAGCVVAWHYDAVHGWLVNHGRAIVLAALAGAALAETWYFLDAEHVLTGLRSSSDPFQPIVLPFNVAAIALIYLVGVKLVRPRRTATVRRLAHVGSDNSFAVYLSQVAFLDVLTGIGWGRLDKVVPWPVTVAGAVVIVFLAGCVLGAVSARLPGARAISGRSREPWPGRARAGRRASPEHGSGGHGSGDGASPERAEAELQPLALAGASTTVSATRGHPAQLLGT